MVLQKGMGRKVYGGSTSALVVYSPEFVRCISHFFFSHMSCQSYRIPKRALPCSIQTNNLSEKVLNALVGRLRSAQLFFVWVCENMSSSPHSVESHKVVIVFGSTTEFERDSFTL